MNPTKSKDTNSKKKPINMLKRFIKSPDLLLKIALTLGGGITAVGLTVKTASSGLPGTRPLTLATILIIGPLALAWIPRISSLWRALGATALACLGIYLRASTEPMARVLPYVAHSGLGLISFRTIYLLGFAVVVAFLPAAISPKTRRRWIYQTLTVLGCLAVLAFWLFPRGFYASTLKCPDRDNLKTPDYNAILPAYRDGDLRYCEWPVTIEEGAPLFSLPAIIEDQKTRVELAHGSAQSDDRRNRRWKRITPKKYDEYFTSRSFIRSLEKTFVSLATSMRAALVLLFAFLLWPVFRREESKKIFPAIAHTSLGIGAFTIPIMNLTLFAFFFFSGLPEAIGVAWRGNIAISLGTILAFALAFIAGRTLKHATSSPKDQDQPHAAQKTA